MQAGRGQLMVDPPAEEAARAIFDYLVKEGILSPRNPCRSRSGGISVRTMSERLQQLLAERPFLLADGATGTNLFAMGLMTGDAPELWNFEHPERIEALHRGMVDAGSDIILTNTLRRQPPIA